MKRSRRLDCCVDAMHAARTEVDHTSAFGGGYHASGFRGEDRLQVHLIHDEGLGELRLRDRRGNLENRLVLEDGRTLRDSVDIAGEPERLQPA
jgi:hypothetical protein